MQGTVVYTDGYILGMAGSRILMHKKACSNVKWQHYYRPEQKKKEDLIITGSTYVDHCKDYSPYKYEKK